MQSSPAQPVQAELVQAQASAPLRRLPWDITPSLKEERLVALSRLASAVRNRVIAEANREEGDTNWGLACKAHERLGHALSRAAELGEVPWLTVNRDGLYLMPLIEGTPIRIYRGLAERPGARHLDALRAESERAQPVQKQTCFSFMDMAPAAPVEVVEDGPWYWLLALETDIEGRVLRAVYFQSNEAGDARHHWVVPSEEALEAQGHVGTSLLPAPRTPSKEGRAPRGRKLRAAGIASSGGEHAAQ